MTVASQVKQTLASLKNAQATLQIYATQSQNPEAQSVFEETSRITKEISREVEQRLRTLEFEEPQYKGL